MKDLKCRNYAHRGFSGEYPENTMIAFEKAIEVGCEGIEMDVHLTKDGRIVIIHDELIDRTSDGKGFVKDYTYEELTKFDFSYTFKDKVGFCRIPTLEEFMELVHDKDIIINIELKTGIIPYQGIEQAVYDMIQKYDMHDKVVISSFGHASVMKMKEIDPTIKCGFLTETGILNVGEYIKSHGVECYHPLFAMLNNPELVADIRSHGLEINTWTVNEVPYIEMLIDLGVEGIIGNYPNLTKEVLERRGLR
ncbi:MAG: glycerophosphodiester phosphodiesterase [Lachnospiraceae bacterium]|nr:glycerophosphodiester phosphodiesterase [Lachnospiraceae bacterium]